MPVTRTDDYSDVVVLDTDGNPIPWSEVSRIDDAQMRGRMREIVNRRYTFHLNCDDLEFRAEIDRWKSVAGKWDELERDPRADLHIDTIKMKRQDFR